MREFVILESLSGFVEKSTFKGCENWTQLDEFRLQEAEKDSEPNARVARCIPRRFPVKLRDFRLVRRLRRVERNLIQSSKEKMEFKPRLELGFEIHGKADFDLGSISVFSISEGVRARFCGATIMISSLPDDIMEGLTSEFDDWKILGKETEIPEKGFMSSDAGRVGYHEEYLSFNLRMGESDFRELATDLINAYDSISDVEVDLMIESFMPEMNDFFEDGTRSAELGILMRSDHDSAWAMARLDGFTVNYSAHDKPPREKIDIKLDVTPHFESDAERDRREFASEISEVKKYLTYVLGALVFFAIVLIGQVWQ